MNKVTRIKNEINSEGVAYEKLSYLEIQKLQEVGYKCIAVENGKYKIIK
jgi:hypothetical protein